MAPTNPPVREIGTPGGIAPVLRPGRTRKYETEPLEQSRDLRFPASIPVYDRVRTDGHVGSVINAILLPTVGANWDLRADGVKDEVVELVRTNLGLPAPGEARSRHGSWGVSWKEHVEQAAEAMLWAGFMAFEQVYRVDPTTGKVHLRKLAPRHPRSITRIGVERDGGLEAIYQTPLMEVGGSWEDVRIGVERLVMYTHRREGADWTGRSILRNTYRHWLIKDVLLRLDAQAAERNSMGIPVIRVSDPADIDRAQEIAEQLRAGEHAGIAIPQGWELSIVGTTGSTVDLVPRFRYHDHEIARSALAMFLDITGSDNGSRALAESVLSVFMESVQAFADSIAETATEHIVRDLVQLNYGPDEPYPEITPGDIKASQGIAVDQLKDLVDSGVIEPDDDLEAHQRSKHGLPDKNHETTRRHSGGGDTPPAPPYADVGVVQDELPGLQDLVAKLGEAQEARTRWYTTRQADK